MRDSWVRRLSALHALVYRLTGGRLGRRLANNDMLLLTARGHVTGEEHTVPLLYLRSGSSLVVVASYGGRPNDPTWYQNLVSDPRVEVQVNRTRTTMVARTATAEERTEWWPRIVAAYPGYLTYESRTDREIPVVFLEPADGAGAETG